MIFKELIANLKSFKWVLNGDYIRTISTVDEYRMCPLVACVRATQPKAKNLRNVEWNTAGHLLGMSIDDAYIVVKAADSSLENLQEALKQYEQSEKDSLYPKPLREKIRIYRRAIHLRRRLEKELLQ